MPRVFVCDDDPGYRALLRVVLTGPFEHVGDASGGAECVRKVAAARPDVVLLDMNMPGMSGIEAAPLIQAEVPDAKLIAMSSGSAEEYENAFLATGGFAFFEKPHNALSINDHLRLALETDAQRAIEVVEEAHRLADLGRREEAYALCAPDITFRPATHPTVLRGIEEIKRYLDSLSPEEKAATCTRVQILANGQKVVVLSVAEIRRVDDVERVPFGTVYDVVDGTIRAVENVLGWEEAKESVGLAANAEPEAKRTLRQRLDLFLGWHGWQLPIAGPVAATPSS